MGVTKTQTPKTQTSKNQIPRFCLKEIKGSERSSEFPGSDISGFRGLSFRDTLQNLLHSAKLLSWETMESILLEYGEKGSRKYFNV